MLRQRQRGDTLIEVLFAVSVFSSVVVGALAIMNQGTAASQRALEITLVRQQIDAQAETLRFMHDSYVAVYQPRIEFTLNDATTSPAEEWFEITKDASASSASDFNVGVACPTPPSGSFVVDPRNVNFVAGPSSLLPAENFSQIEYNNNGTFKAARGMWIEAIRSGIGQGDQSNTGYVDFHIRACWDSSGLSVPMTLGTIVRLYEPRG